MIEAIELTTCRRGRRALEAVSFQVRPGQVTGLLGLPGAGKTEVLRRMLQLDRGGGRTLYDGRPFRSLAFPMRSVGVLLDPLAVHPGRTVGGHLRLALSADPESAPAGRRERIEAVLDVVGLTDQARTRIFELTEGMTVRLGIAQALLGDPQALLLDEPECGLEREGRPWLAALLRAYAAQGRCVLVTGRNTDAMLGYADRILVMDAGRLVGQRATRQAARELAGDCVIVRTPQVLRLAAILVAAGAEPTQLDGACLEVRGLDRARIGDLAFRNEVPLHELSVRKPGDDPVVAVLEACRRPPAVVPVQAPPAVRVPEVAQAVVRMPFESALGSGEARGSGGIGTGVGTGVGNVGAETGSSAANAGGDASIGAGTGPSAAASTSLSTGMRVSAAANASHSVGLSTSASYSAGPAASASHGAGLSTSASPSADPSASAAVSTSFSASAGSGSGVAASAGADAAMGAVHPQAGDTREAEPYGVSRVSPFGQGSAVLRVSAVPKTASPMAATRDTMSPEAVGPRATIPEAVGPEAVGPRETSWAAADRGMAYPEIGDLKTRSPGAMGSEAVSGSATLIASSEFEAPTRLVSVAPAARASELTEPDASMPAMSMPASPRTSADVRPAYAPESKLESVLEFASASDRDAEAGRAYDGASASSSASASASESASESAQ